MTTNGKHETGISGDGEQLLRAWLYAKERVRTAERELNSAQCDQSNTQTELVRWLLPRDAKEGEKIAVWFGDSLVQAECTRAICDGLHEGKITIRQEGKTIREALCR
jgi:hypothetical protein